MRTTPRTAGPGAGGEGRLTGALEGGEFAPFLGRARQGRSRGYGQSPSEDLRLLEV